MQVLYLGRAPHTKETLSDFLKCRRVTRYPLVFRGLTGSQRNPGFWASHHQRKGSTSPYRPGKCWAAGFMQGSQLRLAPFLQVSACIGCHIRLVPLPNGPSFRTDQVCESCLGVEDQSIPQRNEPGSMGEASGRLLVGPRQPVRGGCT